MTTAAFNELKLDDFLAAVDKVERVGIVDHYEDMVRFWLVPVDTLRAFDDMSLLHIAPGEGREARDEADILATLTGTGPCRHDAELPCIAHVSGEIIGLERDRPGLHIDHVEARFDTVNAAVAWLAQLAGMLPLAELTAQTETECFNGHVIVEAKWRAS